MLLGRNGWNETALSFFAFTGGDQPNRGGLSHVHSDLHCLFPRYSLFQNTLIPQHGRDLPLRGNRRPNC